MRGMRRVVVLLAVLAALLVLVGCSKPSIEGKWFNPKTGDVTTIDKEWITDAQGTPVRYTVTGDTALQITKNGQSMDIKYALDGDALTMTMPPVTGEFVRVDSSAYKTAKAAWDKQQAEKKAAADTAAAADKKIADKETCQSNQESLRRQVQWYVGDDSTYYVPDITESHKAEFKVGMTGDAIIALLKQRDPNGLVDLKSLSAADVQTQFGCPNGGIITFVRWSKDISDLMDLECSIHGTAGQ